MSVRDAILGLLTIGPTYGHQILFEVHSRLPHRAHVNPGQIYSTLSRLRDAKEITQAGVTASNLPVYALTPSGESAARAWLGGESSIDVRDWLEILDVCIMASTLPNADFSALTRGLKLQLAALAPDTTPLNEEWAPRAWRAHLNAVHTWLDSVAEDVGSSRVTRRGYAHNRPGRGRRPSAANRPRG